MGRDVLYDLLRFHGILIRGRKRMVKTKGPGYNYFVLGNRFPDPKLNISGGKQKELLEVQMPGITAYPYRIGSPQDKAQPPAAFCHEIFYIRRHIIYDTVADFIFRVITDIDYNVIIGKSLAGQRPEMDFLQLLGRPDQTVVHYFGQCFFGLKICL